MGLMDFLRLKKYTDDKTKTLDDRINNIVANAGSSNTELVDARGGKAVLKDRLDSVDAQLADKASQTDMLDINLMPQSPLPAKQGISTNHYKLAIKNNANDYLFVQKGNKGYLLYNFKNGIGDSSVSVGVSWELLRLISVEKCLDVAVWKQPVPVTGTLTTAIVASDFNGLETNMQPRATAGNTSNRTGLTLFDLAVSSEVTFTLDMVDNPIGNLLFLTNDSRSTNVEISINGTVVKTFNSRNGNPNGQYDTVSFPVPSSKNGTGTYTLKVKNLDATNKFSFVAINYFKLKDYNGESVDSYKIYRTGDYFINETGSSDYAIRDADTGKWCGSYHGGETALYAKMVWNQTENFGRSTYEKESDFTSIVNGDFCLVKDLKIFQQTNINSKAKMTSIFDFNVDGTVNMTFGLTENTIKARDLYTALTCTHLNFKSIIYPTVVGIPDNADTSVKLQNGHIVQGNGVNGDKLGIRFTMFQNKYNTRGSFITQNTSYSKFYYGIVTGYLSGVVIPDLTFSKSLDFYTNNL